MRKLQVCSLSHSPSLLSITPRKPSRTVSSNIPKISLSLFSRTLIFFFKNIQFLQYRLQVCSLIQSFSNSRFTYLFLALYRDYWIPQIFKSFWKIRFESIFVCVCVWRTVRIRRSSCCYLGFGRVTSASSLSQWRRNQRSVGPWVGP